MHTDARTPVFGSVAHTHTPVSLAPSSPWPCSKLTRPHLPSTHHAREGHTPAPTYAQQPFSALAVFVKKKIMTHICTHTDGDPPKQPQRTSILSQHLHLPQHRPRVIQTHRAPGTPCAVLTLNTRTRARMHTTHACIRSATKNSGRDE